MKDGLAPAGPERCPKPKTISEFLFWQEIGSWQQDGDTDSTDVIGMVAD